jgi:hypothetical protein
MDDVAFFKQEFSKVRTVLAGDASDEGFFHDEALESRSGT